MQEQPNATAKQKTDHRLDHFIEEEGLVYAGKHIIVDLYEAEKLDDLNYIQSALKEAVDITGASLLHIHCHHFTPYGGVSGVAVLAESHISLHTWPECGYAAWDIFMCGKTQPEKAIALLKLRFNPKRMTIEKHHRGQYVDAE
jgi:S-adenosylmethionine decarboxylase